MAPAKRTPKTRKALLTVWNPELHPQGIQVHVEHFRKSNAVGGRATWWGRISGDAPNRGPRAAVKSIIQQAAAVFPSPLDESIVVFVTDFNSLHALLVDKIVENIEGQAPDAPKRAEQPTYYHKHNVLLWFRVRDIRALAHDRLVTLSYLRENLRYVPKQGDEPVGFVPYASFGHGYPLVVDAPPVGDVFDPANRQSRKFFADLPSTIFPPVLEEARVRLEKELSGVWDHFDQGTQAFLASARIYLDHWTRHPDLPPGAVVLAIANALERELVQSVLQPLWLRAHRAEFEKNELGEAFRKLTDDHQLTLGSCPKIFPKLATWVGTIGPVNGLGALTTPAWKTWLKSAADCRNAAAHARVRKLKKARWAREEPQVLLSAEGAARWETIVQAKLDVRGLPLAAGSAIHKNKPSRRRP